MGRGCKWISRQVEGAIVSKKLPARLQPSRGSRASLHRHKHAKRFSSALGQVCNCNLPTKQNKTHNKMKTYIITSLAVASTALAGTIDGPVMLTNVAGSVKPMIAHSPTPSTSLGGVAPWAFPRFVARPMDPQVILLPTGVSTYDYMTAARTLTTDLGMCWNTAGGPIPQAANLPSSMPVRWTGLGTGPAYAYHPLAGGVTYPGAIPFHNDSPNGGGVLTAAYTLGAIPNAIVFPTRAAAVPFLGSDEVEFRYSPINGLPMTLDFVEVENLSYAKFTTPAGNPVLIESCSVYINGNRISTFVHQSVPAALRTSFNAQHPGLPYLSPTGAANATLRTPPIPNAFTVARMRPGTVLNPGDKLVIRYDDFGYTTTATGMITGVIPVPPAGRNGNGWALSAISGHQ